MSYGNVFHTDLDGSFLQSLSLSDKHESRTTWHQMDHDDDLMEIDYDYEIEEREVPDTSTQVEEDKIETPIPVEEHIKYQEPQPHDSFVSSILSPTTLGAKLAIRPRLLLLPPPEKEPENYAISNSHKEPPSCHNESSYDHEYTLSILPDIRHRSRNVSSFESRPDVSLFLEKEDEYIFNPTNGNYDQVEPLNQNAMTQSYSYRKSLSPQHEFAYPMGLLGYSRKPTDNYGFNQFGAPIVQHHHHYYFGGKDLTESKENRLLEKREELLEKYTPESWNSPASYPDFNGQIKLPNPWSPASRPLSHLPYILSSYLQLLANAVVFGYAGYVVYIVVLSIREDVTNRVSEQTAKILVEIETCRRLYIENDCLPELVVPYLERQCAIWEKCMNQDPARKGNLSSISAETIGILINSLVEPLGIKFFLLLSTFIVVLFGCNFSFGYVRAKMYYGWSETQRVSEIPATNA